MVARNTARLARLEQALKTTSRQFIVWAGADGDDIEAEKQRLRAAHGPVEDDEFLVVSWLAPQA